MLLFVSSNGFTQSVYSEFDYTNNVIPFLLLLCVQKLRTDSKISTTCSKYIYTEYINMYVPVYQIRPLLLCPTAAYTECTASTRPCQVSRGKWWL